MSQHPGWKSSANRPVRRLTPLRLQSCLPSSQPESNSAMGYDCFITEWWGGGLATTKTSRDSLQVLLLKLSRPCPGSSNASARVASSSRLHGTAEAVLQGVRHLAPSNSNRSNCTPQQRHTGPRAWPGPRFRRPQTGSPVPAHSHRTRSLREKDRSTAAFCLNLSSMSAIVACTEGIRFEAGKPTRRILSTSPMSIVA